MKPEIRESYDDYEVTKEDGKPCILGEGAFGLTLECHRSRKIDGEEIRKNYALKILHKNTAGKERGRFVEEILALCDLSGEHLVWFYDAGANEHGEIYLVMELCRGGNLSDFVKKHGAVSESIAARIGLQVARGIESAHRLELSSRDSGNGRKRSGVLHRDLKPSNLLLTAPVPGISNFESLLERADSKVKIADFGLADRISDKGQAKRRRFGGTAMYASPEQFQELELDGRCDLYSLGMSLWYLVQGRGPFLDPNGKTLRDDKEAGRRHTSPVSHMDSREFLELDISDNFRALLRLFLEKDRDQRVETATAAIELFRRYFEGDDLVKATGFAPIAEEVDTSYLDFVPPPGWGTGSFSDFFEFTDNPKLCARSFGSLYTVREKQNAEISLVTLREDSGDPNTIQQRQLAGYLHHLQRLSRGSGSEFLIPIEGITRTRDEWCIVERPSPGVSVGQFLSNQKKSVSMQDAVEILRPLTHIVEFLQQNEVNHALLNVEEIILEISDPEFLSSGKWKGLAIEQWESWNLRVGVVAVPEAILTDGENSTEGAFSSHTVSGSLEADNDLYDLRKSFARLVYRIVDGAEVANAADWDLNSYVDTSKLSAASNYLLKQCISGTDTTSSTSAILNEICAHEGFYTSSGDSRSHLSRSRSRVEGGSQPSGQSQLREREKGSASAVTKKPESAEDVLPPSRSENSFRQVSGVSRIRGRGSYLSSGSGSVGKSWVEPATLMESLSRHDLIAHSRSTVLDSEGDDDLLSRDGMNDFGERVPGRPGEIISPHSRKRQRIPSERWRRFETVICEVTNQVFNLPAVLDPFDAIIEPDRFDIVISPYKSARTEIRVSPKQWIPGNRIICPLSGEPALLPADLPMRAAQCDEESPGVIYSPWKDFPLRCRIHPKYWKDGSEEIFQVPGDGPLFSLPAEVEPLYLNCLDEPGKFSSPFDLDEPAEVFELLPFRSIPGSLIECPIEEGSLLRVPWELPDSWIFPITTARISKGQGEVRSPYREEDDEEWQAILPEVWKAGAVVKCSSNPGLRFTLGEEIPPLPARASDRQGEAVSPFPPFSKFEVPKRYWGEEPAVYSIGVDGEERFCLLPEEVRSWVPDASIPAAGRALPPFKEVVEQSVPFESWKAGEVLVCKTTQKKFRLPDSGLRSRNTEIDPRIFDHAKNSEFDPDRDLPPLRAEICQQEPGLIRSPCMGGEIQRVDPALWIRGQIFKCPASERWLQIPFDDELPRPLEAKWKVKVFDAVDTETGETVPISGENWRGGFIFPDSSGILHMLPDDLPDPPETLISVPPQEASSGIVSSPHQEGVTVKVDGCDWRPGALVSCPATGKWFRLPTEAAALPPLTAILTEPGSWLVESPYLEGHLEEIEPALWSDGRIFTCGETGISFKLPHEDLLLPHRVVDPDDDGSVSVPQSGMRYLLSPDEWIPNCLISTRSEGKDCQFHLAAKLPDLATANVREGAHAIVSDSNIHDDSGVEISEENWKPGNIVRINGSLQQLPQKLTPYLRVANADYIAVIGDCAEIVSPYAPENAPTVSKWTVVVDGRDWVDCGVIACPGSRRDFLLPTGLPPLIGSIKDADTGKVCDPHSGEVVELELHEWKPGGLVKASNKAEREFLLPDRKSNPPWRPMLAGVENDLPGIAFDPGKRKRSEAFPVPSAKWSVDSEIEDEKGNILRLPSTGLPALQTAELVVEDSKAVNGLVLSPYKTSSKGRKHRIPVPLSDWIPGKALRCSESGLLFVLPAREELPVWTEELKDIDTDSEDESRGLGKCPYCGTEILVDGPRWDADTEIDCSSCNDSGENRRIILPKRLPALVAVLEDRHPGYVVSPYDPVCEAFAVQPDQWQQGALITCPRTGKEFGLPAGETLPLLSGRLTEEKYPGIIYSPWAEETQILVEAREWKDGTKLTCLRTKRPFLLPSSGASPLPLIEEVSDELIHYDEAGVSSPFDSGGNTISPESWEQGFVQRCPATHALFRLPTTLQPPFGSVAENGAGKFGTALSPFGENLEVLVPGFEWKPLAEVSCVETGQAFRLPRSLPALTAGLVPGKPGSITSPYDRSEKTIQFSELDQWRSGGEISCPRTGRRMLLPHELPSVEMVENFRRAGRGRLVLFARVSALILGLLLVGSGVWKLNEKFNFFSGKSGATTESGEPPRTNEKIPVDRSSPDPGVGIADPVVNKPPVIPIGSEEEKEAELSIIEQARKDPRDPDLAFAASREDNIPQDDKEAFLKVAREGFRIVGDTEKEHLALMRLAEMAGTSSAKAVFLDEARSANSVSLDDLLFILKHHPDEDAKKGASLDASRERNLRSEEKYQVWMTLAGIRDTANPDRINYLKKAGAVYARSPEEDLLKKAAQAYRGAFLLGDIPSWGAWHEVVKTNLDPDFSVLKSEGKAALLKTDLSLEAREALAIIMNRRLEGDFTALEWLAENTTDQFDRNIYRARYLSEFPGSKPSYLDSLQWLADHSEDRLTSKQKAEYGWRYFKSLAEEEKQLGKNLKYLSKGVEMGVLDARLHKQEMEAKKLTENLREAQAGQRKTIAELKSENQSLLFQNSQLQTAVDRERQTLDRLIVTGRPTEFAIGQDSTSIPFRTSSVTEVSAGLEGKKYYNVFDEWYKNALKDNPNAKGIVIPGEEWEALEMSADLGVPEAQVRLAAMIADPSETPALLPPGKVDLSDRYEEAAEMAVSLQGNEKMSTQATFTLRLLANGGPEQKAAYEKIVGAVAESEESAPSP